MSFRDPHQVVTDNENAALTAPFSEAEVWAAIKGMNHASAPCADGLPVKFYQIFWDVIKPEVMSLLDEFYVGAVDLSRLNHGIISLIPKVVGAFDILQFRPIMVINMIFRILAKGYANRVTLLADHITHPNPSAFIRDRFILYGVLVFHEVLNEFFFAKALMAGGSPG
ncbi:Signal recognition particle 54 kDa protein, chloroplastic [Hordeum vulgare]|nr:Signal recognition particle 54 kDa protein, chloroplastic [Hordeum vulgare]